MLNRPGDAGPALRELARQFADPPRAFSPVPIWWWSGDRLERGRLRWQMEQLVAGGVYNAVILNLAPSGPLFGADADRPPFFSEDWWAIFLDACADAEALGLRLWFYDQIGFSGANLQAELVRAKPAFAGQWLASVTCEGEGPLEVACPAEGQPLAAAYTVLDAQGGAVGEPQPARLEGLTARAESAQPKRLRLVYAVRRGFDYFSPAACQRLLDTVHGAFEARAGRYLGSVIAGSFQDELPSLPTWGAGFAAEFQRRRGYDLRPHLAYMYEGDGPEAQRVRVDYHQTRAELAEAAFFRPLYEWHARHGLMCGFDQQSPARAGEPLGGVQQYADYMATHRWYAAPGSDHHGHAKIHSSLAHLYRRPRVWLEAFHSSGWGGTLEETFDWLLPWLRAGATLYSPHAVYYSTRGGWWEWAPPSTCWRQPYWRHYPTFARAVSRLCWLLSQGAHVCDIAVLYPTTTIQAGLTLEAPLPLAQHANAVFEALVGGMMFLKMAPGLLDRDRRDFDIVDEASVQSAALRDGALCAADEAYAVIVLPACAVLEAATAEQLRRFVDAGGRLIAIGCLPERVTGGDKQALAALLECFAAGKAVFLPDPEALPAALAQLPRRVEAPVPTLHRRVAGADVVFVPAAFPHATCTPDPPSPYWHKIDYSFDPQRYHRPMTIRARGFAGVPDLWDAVSGERRALAARPVGDAVEIELPFDAAPAALIVWARDAARDAAHDAAHDAVHELANPTPSQAAHDLTGPWTCELEPTLDNRYGDFDKPDHPGAPSVQTWRFWHCAEQPGQDGLRDGWHASGPPPGRTEARATYGRYGWWLGPCAVSDLPPPLPNAPPLPSEWGPAWQPAVYSLSRGLDHDPLHADSLGPKAHVPEEFLRFGVVPPGQAVQFRTAVWVPEARPAHLALGAPAHKAAWLNGTPLGESPPGYLWLAPVALKAGLNVIEWRLVAEEAGETWRIVPEGESELRAYWALVQSPEAFRRPERMTAGEPRKDSRLRFWLDFEVPFVPVGGTVQVAADGPARLLVNDVEAGRQGGFDPYGPLARVQPYPAHGARQGANRIVLEVDDLGSPISVLVDGIIRGPGGEAVALMSGPHWQAQRDGGPAQPATLARQQWLDPAWSHLRRRPHPLPGAAWLEDAPAVGCVLPVVPDAGFGQARVEWFWWRLPPGTVELRLPVAGEARLWVDGIELDTASGTIAVPPAESAHRRAALRVVPERGRTGGGVFTGPVTYRTEAGRIELGDWAEQGLDAYSGGVRYRTRFNWAGPAAGRAHLDLGRVRGTAEVWVNGQPAGVRLWSPYRFDVSAALQTGENEVEILVLNTLAPYLQAVSPTHYVRPGQTVSGLNGPVRLYTQGNTLGPERAETLHPDSWTHIPVTNK